MYLLFVRPVFSLGYVQGNRSWTTFLVSVVRIPSVLITVSVGMETSVCAIDTVTRYSMLAEEHAKHLHDELVLFSPRDTRGPV